jgi:hypothetical protein
MVAAGALITIDRSRCDLGDRNADIIPTSATTLTADIPRIFKALVIIILMVLVRKPKVRDKQ